MMVLFQLVCLCITLYVLQKYITTGAYSHTHRLLPLVLGLIGIYNFLEVLESLGGETAVFSGLKDILIIQMLYLLLFYTLDFLQMKLWRITEKVLFLLLLVMDMVVLFQYGEPQRYERGFLIVVFGFIIFILALGTYAYIRYSFSKREHRVTNMVYLALLVPAVALYLEKFHSVKSEIIMPLSLAFTCIIVYYLLATEQLEDLLVILQENQYEASDIAVVFFDTDYYYLGANQMAKRLLPKELGVSPRKGRPDIYMDMLKDMARNPDRAREMELQERYYKCRLTPVYYHGKLRGYSLSILDITEQKKETKLMANLKDVAENRTVLKSRFLATMTHDLRSPLHAIIGISDILAAKREMSARNRSLLLHLKSAGYTLLEQVDAILDYSKLEAGRLELARNSYNLGSIVEELAHMCAINLQAKPVHFTISLLTEYPKWLIGDEMRVREIIQNLLSNAVKFTKEGEIRCDISSVNEPEIRRAYLTCSVTDTGPGMKQERIEEIFKEYVSLAEDRDQGGAGLGLCIVRQLAERMGGSVTAYSDGVSGFTITASFYQEFDDNCEMCPAFSVTRESMLRQTAAFEGNVRPDFVYPKARVLLADDMRINQEIFRELTMPWKFDLDFAADGKEAVEAVKRQSYQLIFLDQMMPEVMGDEAAELIRAHCSTPLIMMTAGTVEGPERECLLQTFADILPKPIEAVMLKNVIEQYMPGEYRKRPEPGTYGRQTAGTIRAQRRTLETFVREVGPLAGRLEEYAEQDLALFKVKVHGIKGASRQIGRNSLGETAEIMEMAAKTENLAFIQSHMADFLSALSEAVEDVRLELEQLPLEEEPAKQEIYGTKELWEQLKEGFDTYQRQIEESIRLLDTAVLSVGETELLKQAKEACEDLDYERGSGLFVL